MNKIFIDCGFHHGEGLREFVGKLWINSQWTVHCFEANPACCMPERLFKEYDFVPDRMFFRKSTSVGSLTMINIVGHQKAVWTYDGDLDFVMENHFKSESGSPTDGTSIIDGWRSRVKDLTHQSDHSFEDPIKVECIDFSSFIEQFKGCEVYCKMDIEGAEFAVLRKVLRDNNAGILKAIWIEFHDHDVPGESFSTRQQLIKELSKFTTVHLWD
jgi:FkbM family methyltransferase